MKYYGNVAQELDVPHYDLQKRDLETLKQQEI